MGNGGTTMKPYGREKIVHHFKGKKDVHPYPKHLFENWWETICKLVSRRTMKQMFNKQWRNNNDNI